ncbi:uncharacterized protein NFIA_030930 [Aspergillus fischeri NRRL 181]|uniref:Uncharacterized protein n=1 Tax=Neosartorya fischeri (strain ATCC 1020 / DSM 3700 / CBS 544.65 / FGSC A1164 / JCM 1740 / NRRL 181 / WB 181) TaxID=331117 RepID=A1DA29_NEOFI|nr:uncharacterized protein NFIA_030930 [Aspergillus fischeri NRRL 181]EAW20660.1 hypothetical protein NFIA_030930 [Aspergillus fischeri NRRL 181]
MSVTSQDVSAPTIRLVQYAFVPWEAQGREKLTVKLALYCITLLANEASELRPDYAALVPVSQPPLNTASSLNQARTHTASSPRREQPQEQSTGAPKNQSYTDISLTEHGEGQEATIHGCFEYHEHFGGQKATIHDRSKFYGLHICRTTIGARRALPNL